MEVSGQLNAPTALPPGRDPGICRRLGGPQSRSGPSGGKEKKSHHCPCLESNLDRLPRNL